MSPHDDDKFEQVNDLPTLNTAEKFSKAKGNPKKFTQDLTPVEDGLVPVQDIPTPHTPTSVVNLLTLEIQQNPMKAKELFKALSMITVEWESIGTNGFPINEVPVPPGENPKDFVKSSARISHVSGYKLSTIFGKEVAYISKDSPKWRVTILGEYQTDSPIIQNGSIAESIVKKFAEEKLRSKGYITVS